MITKIIYFRKSTLLEKMKLFLTGINMFFLGCVCFTRMYSMLINLFFQELNLVLLSFEHSHLVL